MKHKVFRILFGILIVGLGLRLPLYFESVWYDELYLSDLALGQPVLLLKTLYIDIHPPLYFLFMAGWNRLVGDSEIFLRLPALLFGLGSLVLIYRLGKIYAGQAAGLTAAALAAMSPVHIWYSQEARPYAAMLFLVTLIAWAFERVHVPGAKRRHWWAYGLALFAVVFIHYYMTAYLLMLTALTLWRRSPHRRRLLWLHGILLVLMGAFVGGKMLLSDFSTGRSYLRPFGPEEVGPFFLNWLGLGNSFTPLHAEPTPWLQQTALIGQCLVGCAALLGLWNLWRGRSAEGRAAPLHLILMMLTLPAFLFVLPFIGMEKTYIERSLLTTLPFFFVLLGVGISGWTRIGVQRLSYGIAAIVMVAALAAHFVHRDQWTVYKPNPDWRGVVEVLESDLGSDQQMALYSSYPSPQALTYYDARIQESGRLEDASDRPQKVIKLIQKVFGASGSLSTALQDFVNTSQQDFESWQDQQRANTRLWVHRLHAQDPMSGTEASTPKEFYLLIYPPDEQHHEGVKRVLGDERLEMVDSWEFRRLKLFKLKPHGKLNAKPK